MSNFIPGFLYRVRNVFRRAGVQPPYWLIRLGRRLHGKYNRISHPMAPLAPLAPEAPLASFAAPDRQHASRLEAKVDHILWSIERMEATLYLQSLQSSIQAVPLQAKNPDASPAAGPAVVDPSHQP